MEINRPEVLAEVAAAFARYEDALVHKSPLAAPTPAAQR